MWQSPEAFKQRVREWADKIGVDVQTISMRVPHATSVSSTVALSGMSITRSRATT